MNRAFCIFGAAMKVFIRNSLTRMYCGQNGEWVGEIGQALDFGTIERAGQRAAGHEDLDVVLKYNEPDCELALNPAFCINRMAPRGVLRTGAAV